MSLRGDLLYTTRGYKVDEGILHEGKIKDVKTKFDYINIPILLEYKPISFIALQVGPLLGMQVRRRLFFNNVEHNESLFGIKQFFDAGIVVGAKGEYKQVFIELQYQHGFYSHIQRC